MFPSDSFRLLYQLKYAGFAFGKAQGVKNAVSKAILKASRNLVPVPILNNHTIFTKEVGEWRATRVFVRPGWDGKGRICHRYIDRTCELLGIKDISADVLGRKNPLSIITGFFIALAKQRSIQERAVAEGKSIV